VSNTSHDIKYILHKSIVGLVQTRKASIVIESLLVNSMPYGTEFGGSGIYGWAASSAWVARHFELYICDRCSARLAIES